MVSIKLCGILLIPFCSNPSTLENKQKRSWVHFEGVEAKPSCRGAGAAGRAVPTHLLLLLLGQLHLLPLLLDLRRRQLLLLVVGCQQLLPQAGQLVDHAHELPLLLSQALWSPWASHGGGEREERTFRAVQLLIFSLVCSFTASRA